MPESNTPMGLDFSTPGAISLLTGVDRNGGWMVASRFGGFVRTERFANGSCVRRQVRLGHGEVRYAGAIVHGGVVILNSLGDRQAQLLPVISARDALSFCGMTD